MQSSSEQPLVGEERYVTTRITAAKETTSLAVGFSKSLITSLTNLAGYPDRMKDCLIACTSSCQLVAIRFALWSAPRIVLRFHLCGMADFRCTCSFPGFCMMDFSNKISK